MEINDTVRDYLFCQNWDLVKIVKKVAITKFVDPNGEIWDVFTPRAPCGCTPEMGANQFREWMMCPKHPDLGTLIYGYKEHGWFWISGEVEVTKK